MKIFPMISMILLITFLPACTADEMVTTEEYASSMDEIETESQINLETSGPELQLCRDEQYGFITDYSIYQSPNFPEPDARVASRDPIFGGCLVRVTDRRTDPSSDDTSEGMKNEYSRVQAFNADESLLLARGTEGTWYVYDAASLTPLGQVPLDVDPRWSATDPYLIYYSSSTMLMSYNINSGQTTTVHDFFHDAPGSVMVWTRYEGSPSVDGRYWGLMAEDEEWLTSTYIVYDLEADTVIATRDISSWSEAEREEDSVTISPLGNYFLVQMDAYCEPGELGTDQSPCGLMVYDRDLQNGRGLLRIVGHSDLGVDSSGREVMIYQDIDTDSVSMLDLENGEITVLFPIDFNYSPLGFHFSCLGIDHPGWAVVSTYMGAYPSATWMDDQIILVELAPNARIVRLAHTHSIVNPDMEQDYWAEPQASVNRDLTRIVFTSNWGRTGTAEVDMYMIILPDDWENQVNN